MRWAGCVALGWQVGIDCAGVVFGMEALNWNLDCDAG